MTLRGFGWGLARVLLGLGAGSATTLVLVAQAGRINSLIDQFNAGLPLLLVFLALASALAVGMRDKLSLAVALVGLGVGGWQLGQAALEGYDTVAPDATGLPALKIVTLSTYHSNLTPTGIAAVIGVQAPDVAVLQETNGTTATVVDTLLPRYHRVKSCKARYCTLTILSRWPMRSIKPQYTPHHRQPDIVIGEVRAPFGTFRVINVHMPRPYEDDAPDYLAEIARIARANHGVPTIMAGDFNTASGSFGLQRFRHASGLIRRDGFIPTYPANRQLPAFVGIDHVFADTRWASYGCERTAAGGSDHYGVACRLRGDWPQQRFAEVPAIR